MVTLTSLPFFNRRTVLRDHVVGVHHVAAALAHLVLEAGRREDWLDASVLTTIPSIWSIDDPLSLAAFGGKNEEKPPKKKVHGGRHAAAQDRLGRTQGMVTPTKGRRAKEPPC